MENLNICLWMYAYKLTSRESPPLSLCWCSTLLTLSLLSLDASTSVLRRNVKLYGRCRCQTRFYATTSMKIWSIVNRLPFFFFILVSSKIEEKKGMLADGVMLWLISFIEFFWEKMNSHGYSNILTFNLSNVTQVRQSPSVFRLMTLRC